MDIETFKKWLPFYKESTGSMLFSNVPTELARTMLQLSRESNVDCELLPEGEGTWIVKIRGAKATRGANSSGAG